MHEEAQVEGAGTPTGAAAVFGPTVNAIFAPGRAFEALDARPLLAIWPLVWTAVGMVLLAFWNLELTRQVTRVAMVQGMMERGGDANPEQMRQMIEGFDRFAPFVAIGQNLAIVLVVVIIGALFWMGASLAGGRTSFGRSLGVASVGAIIHPLLATTFVSVMWKLNPPEIRRMEDMFDALPSLGLDLLVRGGETSAFVRVLLARVDLFNAWWVVVVVLGAEKLLGLKRGAAVGLALGVWLVTSLISASFASMGA